MTVNREVIDELTALDLRPAVSILMPVHPAGPPIRQDPIRLKNLLREAERQLDARGLARGDVARVMGPAHELVEEREFWRHQQQGLALYAAPNFFRSYRIGYPLAERAIVSDHFHVTQLFPGIAAQTRFHVLALSQKDVRLIEATGGSAVEVDLGAIPRSIPEALLLDSPGQRLQSHVGGVAGSDRAQIFHGHGAAVDEPKQAIRQFFHRLDRELHRFLPSRPTPLVLAAVEYLVPLYRDTNSHPGLLDEAILGNPEGVPAEVLAARGWDIVRRHLEAAESAALARYRDRIGSGRVAEGVAAVLRASHEGRVDELFVASGAERWGTFAANSGAVELTDGPRAAAEDLVNLAVIEAYRRGATIRVLDPARVPGNAEIAATLRY